MPTQPDINTAGGHYVLRIKGYHRSGLVAFTGASQVAQQRRTKHLSSMDILRNTACCPYN